MRMNNLNGVLSLGKELSELGIPIFQKGLVPFRTRGELF